MENLLLSFNVVAPLTIYLLIGVVIRRCGVLNDDACTRVMQIVFYAALPALCAKNMMESDLAAIVRDPFTLYLALGVTVVFAVTVLLVPRFERDDRRRGVLVQGIFRSNDGIFGLAVATALLGAGNIGLMVVGVAMTIPIFNLFGVAEMEYFSGKKLSIGKVLLKVLKNPIILGCLAGFLLNVLHITLPSAIVSTMGNLGGLCAPLGFIALGARLSFSSMKRNRTALTLVTLLRLIVIPACALTVFYLLGYRGDHLLVVMIIFGAPSAVTTYALASAMNGDEELASEIVAVTSVVSILTVFLFIFLLKQLGVA